MATTTIKVEGMTCGGCTASVERALKQLDGVKNVDVSLDRKEAAVEYDSARIEPAKLRSAIEDAGYDVV